MFASRTGLAGVLSVALATACFAVPSPPARAAFVPEIAAQIGDSGTAEVFVLLRPPRRLPRRDLGTRQRMIADQRAATLAALPSAAVRVLDTLTTVSGFTAAVTAAGLDALLAYPDVLGVEPMRYGSGALAQSVPQIRADAVHRRDDDGQGVTVAVLDTGVDPTHPDLAGSIAAEQCFCSGNCCPNGANQQSGAGSAFTTFVHGIHVAGIIVSKGIVAPQGVAPGAQLVAVKVLNDENRGSLTDWILALDWIATMRPDVQVINMSLVSDAVYSGACDQADSLTMAFAQVLDVLRARGVLTFVAAGNTGETAALGAPACVSTAVAVGAVNKQDVIAAFSDTDTTLDLLAPGVDIVSAGPQHSAVPLTGTSMAAPHATGTAALMLAINPALGASQLESVLKDTGVPIRDARNGRSVSRIDALAAMNAVLSVTSPLQGGGSAASDCLVEWNFTPPAVAKWRPVAGAVCRDNDPTCDADQASGQCTFRVAACFNMPDRRLPRCTTTSPIVAYRLSTKSAAGLANAIDAANAAAFAAALPAVPINDANHCTGDVSVVVPVGRPRWIRFTAQAADGRIDYDRLRLTCLP